MEWEIKRFNKLETEQLYEILKARYEVFTVGQKCLYQDCDDKDKDSYHLYLREGKRVLAYLRIVDKGIAYDEVSIGRVLVVDSHRRKGLAREMMNRALAFINDELKEADVKISAQEYLVHFYESLGFKRSSEVYLEAGMEHVKMIYRDDYKTHKYTKAKDIKRKNLSEKSDGNKLSIYATLGLAFLTYIGANTYRHIFTSEKWINQASNRNEIVFDLLKKHKLIGMTEDEIINLLGEQEADEKTKTSFKTSKEYHNPDDTIVYYLGAEDADDMWLIISLDKGIANDYLIDLS